MVEKVAVNPKYYEKMSAILDELIQKRKQGVISYKELLEEQIKLAKNVEHPEQNEDYPESIRKSKALQALYDNTDGNEVLAIKLHNAVLSSNDDSEVERLFKIIEKQEEY